MPVTRRQGAWEAALAQEQELYGRCSSTVVYQNLAARTSATQWRTEQRQDRQQEAAQSEAPVAQQRQAVEAQAAGQREEARQQQPTQQASDGRQAGQQGPGTAAGPKRAPASKQPRLEEVDIDWEAALPESLAEGSSAPAATGAARSTGRTELGTGEFAPLSAGQQNSTTCKPEAPAENEASKPTETATPGAAPAAAEAERQHAPGGPQAAPAQAAGKAANAALDTVQQQVELFVRAELHPMLQRRQINQELHDAGMQGQGRLVRGQLDLPARQAPPELLLPWMQPCCSVRSVLQVGCTRCRHASQPCPPLCCWCVQWLPGAPPKLCNATRAPHRQTFW